MKPKLLFFLCLIIACHCDAQTASGYLENATMGTFTDISGMTGVNVVSLACDDCNATGISIGFTINYCGVNYTSLSASSNGFLCLNNSASAPGLNSAGNITGPGMIMPFWDDLTGIAKVGSTTTPSAYYITTGTAPNRVFIFEWKEFNNKRTCTSCVSSFEVKLYEKTWAIEFVYGLCAFSAMDGTIGIANSTTDWQTLDGYGSLPMPSSTVFTSTLLSAPVSGQVYRWFPPCSGTPLGGSVVPSLASGCDTFNSLLTLTGASALGGIILEWQSSPDGTSWTVMPSLYTDTTTVHVEKPIYYRCKVNCSYSGISSYSTSLQLGNEIISDITGADSVCDNRTITLANATSGGVWSTDNTSLATVSGSGLVSGASSGAVNVNYTVGTCVASKQVYVKPCKLSVSGSNEAAAHLDMYPNPNSGTFSVNISGIGDEPVSISIVDAMGRQVKQLYTKMNKTIECSDRFPPGLYMITAITSQGKVASRFVIE